MGRQMPQFAPQIVSQLTKLKGQSLELLFLCACETLLKDRVLDTTTTSPASASSPSSGWHLERQQQLHQLNLSPQELPKVFALACSIATLLARENRSADDNRTFLTELGFSQEITDQVLLPLFKDQLPRLQWILSKTKLDLAEIVDVSWRLDLVVRSKSEGVVHEPKYFVNFTVQKPDGELEDLPMTCSIDELREIVYKLQELRQQIARMEGSLVSSSSLGSQPQQPQHHEQSTAPGSMQPMMRLHSMP